MTTTNVKGLNIGKGRTLAEVAYDEMTRLIREGTWPAHMRLPSEAELSKQFTMSRPVIRQALARMRDEGLIQSRQGSGSFVREVEQTASADPFVNFPSITSLADLDAFLNFREALEVEAAATAAHRHTDEQMEEVQAAARRLSHDTGNNTEAISDYTFHMAVAIASNNPFYTNSLVSLRGHMLIGLNLEWSFSGSQVEFRDNVTLQHHTIMDAIARRDPDQARNAMRSHLRWARSMLVTGNGVLDDN